MHRSRTQSLCMVCGASLQRPAGQPAVRGAQVNLRTLGVGVSPNHTYGRDSELNTAKPIYNSRPVTSSYPCLHRPSGLVATGCRGIRDTLLAPAARARPSRGTYLAVTAGVAVGSTLHGNGMHPESYSLQVKLVGARPCDYGLFGCRSRVSHFIIEYCQT